MNYKSLLVIIVVLALGAKTSTKEVWYLSWDVIQNARVSIALQYYEVRLEHEKELKRKGISDNISNIDFDDILDRMIHFGCMIESPLSRSYFHVYAVDDQYIVDNDFVVYAVTPDSGWLLGAPIIRSAIDDYARELDYLLKIEGRQELSSQYALKLTLFAFELANISAKTPPHVLYSWQDIFKGIGSGIPDTIDADNDPIYRIIAAPKVTSDSSGHHVTVYWWTTDKKVHRTLFTVTHNAFTITKDEVLGLRGKSGGRI